MTAETIVAIATPPGRGGVGVVRLSGPEARSIGLALLELRRDLTVGRVHFGYLLDKDEEAAANAGVLDEVLTTYFAAPHSYTGEDVLEIATHGSPVVLQAVVEGAIRKGARLAEPGEFTQRAFLAGRLDLTQAEAVHDLIQATTRHQARMAASQLGGALSRVLTPLKAKLVLLIATLEAGIDFAEDDLEVMPQAEIVARTAIIRQALSKLEESFRYGQALRQGATIVIVGRPNAGKSSLFNALLERDRAIVTATAGTTRDVIAERVSVDGLPVELMDTAGLREATDEIEALGIKRSRETLAEAAVVLLVVDAGQAECAADVAVLRELADRVVITVLNKADIASAGELTNLEHSLRSIDGGMVVVRTSARTGAGVPELRSAIHAILVGDHAMQDSAIVTNVRQHTAVVEAIDALTTAESALGSAVPHEMVLLDLRRALLALDALTGQTASEDVLNLIFSTFCIGK